MLISKETLFSKEELFRPFETKVSIELNGVAEQFEVEWIKGELLFRPLGAPLDLVWNASLVLSWDTYGATEEEITRVIAGGLRNVTAGQRFYRVVPAPPTIAAPQGTQFLLRLGESGIRLPGLRHDANWNVVFPWLKGQAAFLRAPLSELEFEIIRAIGNTPDEWRSVLAWAQMNQDERFWSLVSWKRGGELEWKPVVRALLQLELHRKPRQNNFGWEVFALNNPRFAFGPLRMTKHFFMNQGFAPSVWQLLEVVEEHFGARIDYSRHRGFTRPFRAVPRTVICASCPTHHELMEALDLWRDFGCRSEQLVRVEELLRELLV